MIISRVYSIPLQNLDDNQLEVYIGATAQNFKDRISEHKDNVHKGDLNTALAQRVCEKNTEVLWQDARIINVNNRKDLSLVEKLDTKK